MNKYMQMADELSKQNLLKLKFYLATKKPSNP